MAASSESSKPIFHTRSISLPSKSHPLVTIVEDQLRACDATPSSSLGYKLGGLKDLYESVDDMLQLPIACHNSEKDMDAMLDGSLRLLDICGTTRDIFSQMKKSVQELESSLRRKRGEGSSIENDVKAYLISRKRLSKVISKCLGSSKRSEKNCIAEKNLADLLQQVEETSLAIFESLLSQISPKSRSRLWSLVYKLVKSRQVYREEQADVNGMAQMDADLLSLIGKKSSPVRVQDALKGLGDLESSIQETGEELECVCRRLLKARVSLLNLLNTNLLSFHQFCKIQI